SRRSWPPLTRGRAALASWRAAASDRPTIRAISSKGRSNKSCSTKATRSTGIKVLKTIRRAEPTESASRASSAGLAWRGFSGASRCSSSDSSFLDLRDRSMSRQTLATTVVSQPLRFSTLLTSERVRRNQASWTASADSPLEPRIRQATALNWGRFSWNFWASQSLSVISDSPSNFSSHFPTVIRHLDDERERTGVTRFIHPHHYPCKRREHQ